MDDEVTNAISLINRNFGARLTIAAIAKTVGRNRTYLAETFRNQVGLTIGDYLRDVRMRQARKLLASGEKVDAVIDEVGYRSRRAFYRHFMAYTGVTPGKARHK